MAKAPRIDPLTSAPIPEAMRRHIRDLGFDTVSDYLDWCLRLGFEYSTRKLPVRMQREREWRRLEVDRVATQAQIFRHPEAFLYQLCHNRVTDQDVSEASHRAACQVVLESPDDPVSRTALADFLIALCRYGDFMFQLADSALHEPIMRGLVHIFAFEAFWIRDLSEWAPEPGSPDTMLSQLAHHLFDRFGDVPGFLDGAWLRLGETGQRYQGCFIHIGRGNSVRTADWPVRLTRGAAHALRDAPRDLTVERAIRWAQMRALGMSGEAAETACIPRLMSHFDEEEFKQNLMAYLARHPDLTPDEVGVLTAFALNQKFEAQVIRVDYFHTQAAPAPQPGFSLKSRLVEALLRQANDWSLTPLLGNGKRNVVYAADSAGDFTVEAPSRFGLSGWTIRQVRSSADLSKEGRVMANCVERYHRQCLSGNCSIWSLTCNSGWGVQHRGTIELRDGWQIKQAKGPRNDALDAYEWAIVQAWAGARGLKIDV